MAVVSAAVRVAATIASSSAVELAATLDVGLGWRGEGVRL